MKTTNRTSRVLLALLATACPLGGTAGLTLAAPRPVLAVEDGKPESAPTSRLIGVALPDGAFRLTDAGAQQELGAQLGTVAKEGGFTLGRTEALIWGGKEHTAARNRTVKEGLIQTLKKGGYSYEVAHEKKTEDGLVTFFVAGKEGAGQATLGFFAASDTYLVLAWGQITPKDGAKQSEKQGAEPEALPRAAGGEESGAPRPATAAKSAAKAKLPPAEQKRLDEALAAAIEGSKAEEVKALLVQGADPNGRTGFGQSMLMRGVIRGGKEVVAALLEAGADPSYGNGRDIPLFLASLTGELAIVDLLLDKGASVNAAAPDSGLTALHGAVIGKEVDVAKRLLERGANKNLRDKSGKTALEAAERERDNPVAAVLRTADDE